jgi:hypothetical protein
MSTNDDFVQVATDGTGKQIDMSLVPSAATTSGTVRRQRAEITDPVADAILQQAQIQRLMLANLRGILQALTQGDQSEDNFLD